MELLESIDILPTELKNQILEYLPLRYAVFLNKQTYFMYHKLIKKWIPTTSYDNYIRFIVRNDYNVCFQQLINDNYKSWIKLKKYKYNNIIYSSYCNFLNCYCIENQSNKCRAIVLHFLSENQGISKNQHKNNSYIHIRWKR
uniref:F-box domain-containing protein n=1 Tax=viral metagenome TaxID=1070528 RepID=A0A6C0E2E1_9ZZZZ